MSVQSMRDFGRRHALAWGGGDSARVAGFFGERASPTINGGAPSVGRAAIAAATQDFVTAFPDLVVTMDEVAAVGERCVFRWTWTDTNTGPGATGRHARTSGYEEWMRGADGLVARSLGQFDEAGYQRQLGLAE